MGTAATIATIGATQCGKLIPPEMLTTGTAMSATAKNANLINEITFLQNCIFTKVISAFAKAMTDNCKYTLTIIKPPVK